MGIPLDPSLTLDVYTNKLSKVAFLQLRCIAQFRSYIHPKDVELFVRAFITSRIDYCNALFADLPAQSISRLQYIQNSAAKILTYTKLSAHITPVLFNHPWLPVSSRIIYIIILLTFKSISGLAPCYFSDLLSPYIPARSLQSSGCNLLTVSKILSIFNV